MYVFTKQVKRNFQFSQIEFVMCSGRYSVLLKIVPEKQCRIRYLLVAMNYVLQICLLNIQNGLYFSIKM